MADKKATSKKAVQGDVKKFNKQMEAFDKALNEVRRDYIQKSSNSKRSASKLVLTS